jgi:hypothetical protein
MIVLFQGTGPIGAAIRWQTRGKYSHAGWLCRDGSIIEAWHQGGVLHSDSPFVLHGEGAKFDVYSVHGITSEQSRKVEAFLHEQVGSGYDFVGVLRFLSHVNRNNYKRWFCSELVAEACEEAHLPLLMTEAWRISPTALSWSTELHPVSMGAGISWWEAFYRRRADIPERRSLIETIALEDNCPAT